MGFSRETGERERERVREMDVSFALPSFLPKEGRSKKTLRDPHTHSFEYGGDREISTIPYYYVQREEEFVLERSSEELEEREEVGKSR